MNNNLSIWLASHLMGGHRKAHKVAGPAVGVATAAVALGMVVMMLSIAIGFGFKREIRNKIVGFGTHVQIMSLDLNSSMETAPISRNEEIENAVRDIDGVSSIQPFVTKPGIIKTEEAFHGIALKGVDHAYDWTFMRSILETGDVVPTSDSTKSDGILLSRSVTDQLHLSVGDPVRMFFVRDGIRARRFTLCGIFNSHFDEIDQALAYVDMRQLRPLNDWSNNQISGYEILLDDFDSMDRVASSVAAITMAHSDSDTSMLRVRHIKDLQPQIFGWLNLLDQNIVVILVLIIAVAGLNMISGLLIIILEHTNNIGLLKAMGSPDGLLRRTFIMMALRIVGKGMVIGNIIGLALCFIQHETGLVKLDAANYYLDTVPIYLTPAMFMALNAGVFTISVLMLIAPSGMIARISPAKAIRFN